MSLKIDEETHLELLIAIYQYLKDRQCDEAAKTLANEIERSKLLPVRRDYLGKKHQRTLQEYEQSLSNSQSTLISLIERLSELVNEAVPTSLSNLPLRIFSSKSFALNRTSDSSLKLPRLQNAMYQKASNSMRQLNPVRTLIAREMGRSVSTKQLLNKASMNSLDLHCCILGHLSSVFCVAFDRTGHYVMTGADDNLVKVWSVLSGSLRYTFRGHACEISDMSVSSDNTMLATGSVDKCVRIWCLQTAAPLALLKNHTAMITSVTFLPFVDGDTRYLVSAGGDCIVNFYRFSAQRRSFIDEPTRFYERITTGSRIVSSTCSTGGSFYAVGDTHHYVHVYHITRDNVEKIADVEAHSDHVDSLAWACEDVRFATGSRDGLAKIWNYNCGEWVPMELRANVKVEKTVSSRNTYKVTMLCWSRDDAFLVTAGSDYVLRVWSSETGAELRQLEGHKDSAYVLTSHPIFEDYVLSAGHDGLLMVWDLSSGVLVRRHQNHLNTCGNGAIFDLAISDDGTLVATVDSHGRLSILGVGTNQRAKTSPYEQFFHTDYMSVIVDDSNNFVDEESGIEPHLMAPARLVNADGIDHDVEVQLGFRPDIAYVGLDGSNMPLYTWGSRQLICRLNPGTVEIENGVASGLREMEESAFQRETSKTRPHVSKEDVMIKDAKVDLRRQRESIRRGLLRERVQRFLDETVQLDSVPSDHSSLDSSFMSPEEESASDSSDSEYIDTTTKRTMRRRANDGTGPSNSDANRVQSRRRRRIANTVSDSDEAASFFEFGDLSGDDGNDDNEQDANDDDETGNDQLEIERTPVPSGSSHTTTTNEDDEPGPSSRRPGSRLRPSSSRRTRTATSNAVSNYNSSSLDFPSWMRLTQPLRFPYIAQVGDEVVYFRQGHEMYLKAVKKKSLYHVTRHLYPLAQLNAEEFCIVDEVKYVRKPYRLTFIKLSQVTETGARTGLIFDVKFHDMDDVPDFIILRHLYDESVARRYQPGTRIETILDDRWWTGTIDKREVHDEENYPRSNWYCLTVRWDTGEDEKISPWDVQPQQPNRRSSLASEIDKVRFSQYPVNDRDWICAASGIDACSARMLDAIQTLREHPSVQPFMTPVNLDEYPDYLLDVDYPIDLRTVEKRVTNRYYRRLISLQQDIRYIAINARLFNEPNSEIVRNSRVLVETLIRYLRDQQYTNVMQLFMDLKYGPDTELCEYQSVDRCPNAGSSALLNGHTNDQQCAETRNGPSNSNDPKIEWMIECERRLGELMEKSYAQYFVTDENAIMKEAIKDGCCNLQTIREKIELREFASPMEIIDAGKKLMQTVRNLCENKRSMIFRDSLAFSAAFNDELAPIAAKWQRMSQVENPDGSKGHCLRARQKNSHVYNTRSRHDTRESGENSGVRTSRSGRSVRIPNGYYRDLNNGELHQSDEGKMSCCEKPRTSKPDKKRNSSAHKTRKPPTKPSKNNQNHRDDDSMDEDKPGPSGIQNLRRSNRSTRNNSSERPRNVKSEQSESEEESKPIDVSNDSWSSRRERADGNRKRTKRVSSDSEARDSKKTKCEKALRSRTQQNSGTNTEQQMRSRLRRSTHRVNYNEEEFDSDYSD